jgi:hypothetical protein
MANRHMTRTWRAGLCFVFSFIFVGWFWGTLVVCAVVEIMTARFLIPGFFAGIENASLQRGLYLVPY